MTVECSKEQDEIKGIPEEIPRSLLPDDKPTPIKQMHIDTLVKEMDITTDLDSHQEQVSSHIINDHTHTKLNANEEISVDDARISYSDSFLNKDDILQSTISKEVIVNELMFIEKDEFIDNEICIKTSELPVSTNENFLPTDEIIEEAKDVSTEKEVYEEKTCPKFETTHLNFAQELANAVQESVTSQILSPVDNTEIKDSSAASAHFDSYAEDVIQSPINNTNVADVISPLHIVNEGIKLEQPVEMIQEVGSIEVKPEVDVKQIQQETPVETKPEELSEIMCPKKTIHDTEDVEKTPVPSKPNDIKVMKTTLTKKPIMKAPMPQTKTEKVPTKSVKAVKETIIKSTKVSATLNKLGPVKSTTSKTKLELSTDKKVPINDDSKHTSSVRTVATKPNKINLKMACGISATKPMTVTLGTVETKSAKTTPVKLQGTDIKQVPRSTITPTKTSSTFRASPAPKLRTAQPTTKSPNATVKAAPLSNKVIY